MAKRKERINYCDEYFTIENKTVTNITQNFKSLDMCYERPSYAKQNIYDFWYEFFNRYGVKYMGHGITSYNCMQFTYGGYICLDGVIYYAYITKSYNRLYKVVNA